MRSRGGQNEFVNLPRMIQGEQLRVTSKSKDDLQSAMALIRGGNFGVDLQFKNFR